jgi:hypothetical protein
VPVQSRIRQSPLARYAGLLVGLFVAAFVLRVARAQAPPTETLTFRAVADAHVDAGAPTANFDSAAFLEADANPIRIIYLRFVVTDVNGRNVQQARLRLECINASVIGGTIHRITSNSWNAATLTSDTKPPVDGPGLQTLGAVSAGQVVEFDLDGVISGDGTYDLAIDSSSPDGVRYVSTAATSGQQPQLVLTVEASANPSVTISQPASGAMFFSGDPITLQANATDPIDGNISSAVTWRSNLAGTLGSGATLTRTLGQGTHTLTASVTASGKRTSSAQVTVTVNPPAAGNTEPLVTITAPNDGQVTTAGQPVTFMGAAYDLEDGTITNTLAWTSSLDGAIGTGGTFTGTLSAGTHRITAAAADSQGMTGAATVDVNVA